MDDAKAQALQRIKDAVNVLVTVSSSPSVDQLAAAIGLTLLLNKMGKHATAVFSGQVPSTIEFLKPEKTLEKTTDSLRDFIIALDKSKADKLRYKIEDQHVKIFITPYRTSISQDDLDFSQGDFNVDVVVALGVREQQDLDAVITAHGRILHDATVISVNTSDISNLGTINWLEPEASSLSEMLAELGEELKPDSFDAQMATALLTGIVAETDRFSNSKTTSKTMNISAKLMAAGANQQLVASELQASGSIHSAPPENDSKNDDENNGDDKGSLKIEHTGPDSDDDQGRDTSIPEDSVEETKPEEEEKRLKKVIEPLPHEEESGSILPDTPKIVLEPPTLGGTLTANAAPEPLDPTTDPMSLPPVSAPLLDHTPPAQEVPSPDVANILQSVSAPADDDNPAAPPAAPVPPSLQEPPPIPVPPVPADDQPVQVDETADQELADQPDYATTEPPASDEPTATNPDLDAARNAVSDAMTARDANAPPLEPIAALNANPVDLNLGHDEATLPPTPAQVLPTSDNQVPPAISQEPTHPSIPASEPPPQTAPPQQTQEDYFDITKLDESTGLPANLVPPNDSLPPDNTAASVENPTAPPPVPPPMMPPPSAATEPPTGSILSHGQQPLPNAEDDNDARDPFAPL